MLDKIFKNFIQPRWGWVFVVLCTPGFAGGYSYLSPLDFLQINLKERVG